VNSLHDGMNLVAKEFVAARDDEDGVLILSTFAGASRELPEALLVNPYDVGETAEAIGTALDMLREERRKRMQLMRRQVSEFNVYRWAGRMLMDVARIRQRAALESWPAP
jgi:trehalose 6-phosphate synthase